MNEAPRRPRPGSLASMLNGLVSLLFTRAEFARLEWQEQQERLLFQMMLVAMAVLLLLAALIALLMFVALVIPETWRACVMGWLALLLAGAGGSLLLWARRRSEAAPPAFATTLQEIRKDWQGIAGKDLS